MYRSVNPANSELLAEFNFFTDAEIEKRISKASLSLHTHIAKSSIRERKAKVNKLAELLEESADSLAKTISGEMGKPIDQSYAEIEKCQWLCRYYASTAEHSLQEKVLDAGDDKSYIRYDPLGAIFGIMPWNFPFWQCFRYAVPCLLAGNVILLKPASNVGLCGLALERLFQEAFGEEGFFQALLIDTSQVEKVIQSPVIQGVTLTGSERAGASVAGLAGKYLKKSVLELGGSDPFIVLEDADLEKAARIYVASRMNNNGQTCIAAKRLLIRKEVYDDFVDLLKKEYRSLKVGEPLEEDVQISYLSREDITEKIRDQLNASVSMGAKVVVEGGRENDSNRFLPVLLTGIVSDMPVWNEEVFGPIGIIKSVSNDGEIIDLANDSRYGLGCSIWSNDIEKAERIATKIQAGSIHINKLVSSDPRVPFGGVKHSGYGRELGEEGLKEFANVKTVTISEGN